MCTILPWKSLPETEIKTYKKKHNLRLNIIQYFQEPAGCEYKIKYILFFFTIYSFLLMTE